MAKKRQVVYWDSSCFLAVLNNEQQADRCVSILNEAKNGTLLLVVSPLTMAETVRPRGADAPLPKEIRQQVLAFFENEYIQLINFDREMAYKSLDLCWEYGLHPRDALHLACALTIECDALETLDEGFIKKLQACNLPIHVRAPIGSGQGDLPNCQ